MPYAGFNSKKAAAVIVVTMLALGRSASLGQFAPSSPLLEKGQVSIAGQQVAYRIRNLPISSFPDVPQRIAEAIDQRGCVIPQSYQARRPENVIHGSLERAGSDDWAVLCSAHEQVSLLVFLSSAPPGEPAVLSVAAKTDRLQPHDLTGELGFNWGIDPANPTRVHEAQSVMAHRPPAPEHDSIADITLDHRTVYHLYRNGTWETLATE